MEKLQDDVSTLLLTLEKPELIRVCEQLKCSRPSDGGFQAKNRRALIRLTERTLEEIEEGEEPEQFSKYLSDLLSFMGSLQQPRDKEQTSEIVKLKEEYSQLQQAQAEARRVLEEKMEALGLKENRKASGTAGSEEKTTATPLAAPEVTLRKEFRISGQIGEAGQKDKLSYTSLTNQMESGVKKGYSDVEIIEAVVRAVSPGLHLRDLLEVKQDLTLQMLKTILKGHYKVDSSADLLHRLMNISQDPKESVHSFLFRAIELRERLARKSGDEEEGERFSSNLIHRKFLRSLETGLICDAVKNQLKPHLSDPTVTDETLIEKLNEAASLEQERQNKQRKTAAWKQPKLNEIHTEHSGETAKRDVAAEREEVSSTLKKKQSKVKELDVDSNSIADLKAEVMEIKKMFLETMEAARLHHHPGTRPPSVVKWTKGCKACQETNVGESCNHCYRCGQEGHLSRGCRLKRPAQGNGRGLLSQDRQ